jgi:enoyl-CoA hydratase
MQTEQAEVVRVARNGRVAQITIDNPPVNALSVDIAEAVASAVDAVAADRAVRAVVVAGAGERAFAAGADIHQFAGVGAARGAEILGAYRHMVERVASCAKPTVAAIRGFCLGGGLELALACDFRIAADTAQLGLPEVTLGLLPGAGGTQVLPRLIGPRRAQLLYLTGVPVSGTRAFEWGLVEEVVPADGVERAAAELAARLAAGSPHAIGVLRELARETAELPLQQGLALEAEGFLRCLTSPDGREGVAAFLERRRPAWTEA